MVWLFDRFVPLYVNHEIVVEINLATIKQLNLMNPYESKQHVVKHLKIFFLNIESLKIYFSSKNFNIKFLQVRI